MIEKLEKLIFGQKISKTIEIENRHRKVGRSKRTFLSQFVIAHLISLPSAFWPFKTLFFNHFQEISNLLGERRMQ
jgi:hypothetical protein